MIISEETTIGALIKHHPNALDAIISLSNKFEKLRNPILRKLMANRTSIAQAAKIGGCSSNDFFKVLSPLGFEADTDRSAQQIKEVRPMPDFLNTVNAEQIIILDVRPILNGGTDPLQVIMKTVSGLQPGQVLKLIANFEPTPLIALLEKKGWSAYCHWADSDTAETYFYRKAETQKDAPTSVDAPAATDWEAVFQQFSPNITYIDVRELEMPKPMQTILASLKKLPAGKLLYVYHKRFPVYLVDELKAGGYDYRVKELAPGEVHLMIFKEL